MQELLRLSLATLKQIALLHLLNASNFEKFKWASQGDPILKLC